MTTWTTRAKARLSVSTWSLHRALGRPAPYGPDETLPPAIVYGALSLLEAPARLAAFGIHTLEICHFHLPSRDPGYLAELRGALAAAGVELWSLLVDSGDISHLQYGPRDLTWSQGWIDVAAQLGARNVRVSAGKSAPTPDALERSRQGMERLARYAQERGVRLMTENWHNLMANSTIVLEMLDSLEGQAGLCMDFGNWHGPNKYAELAAIAPRAESCHAKARFSAPGEMDRDDYVRCLELAQAAGFAGPYTLIYDGPGDDEWAGLALEREVVLSYL